MKIGDKVTFADHLNMDKNKVFQIVDIEGNKLILHCGTFLLKTEAKIVDINSKLNT